jgi:hypothetical protein
MNFVKYLLLLLAIALSGCAAVEKQAYNRAANTHIKSITIIEPKPSDGFGVQVMSHPALSFGLIGAIAYATEMNTKSNALDSVMKPLNWSLTDSLTDATAKVLEAAGYVVKRLKVERPVGVISDYKSIIANKSHADLLATNAWLDLATRDPLYIAGGTTASYVPSIMLTARLVSSKDQTLLYRDDIYFGYPYGAGRVAPVMIPSGQEYQFPEHGSLLADPPKTLAGMKEGVDLISKRLAIDLAREVNAPPTASPVPPVPAPQK